MVIKLETYRVNMDFSTSFIYFFRWLASFHFKSKTALKELKCMQSKWECQNEMALPPREMESTSRISWHFPCI